MYKNSLRKVNGSRGRKVVSASSIGIDTNILYVVSFKWNEYDARCPHSLFQVPIPEQNEHCRGCELTNWAKATAVRGGSRFLASSSVTADICANLDLLKLKTGRMMCSNHSHGCCKSTLPDHSMHHVAHVSLPQYRSFPIPVCPS